MGAVLQTRKMFDTIAASAELTGAANASFGLWALRDAAGDQPFENALTGDDFTNADTAVKAGEMWGDPTIKKVFDRFNEYFSNRLASAYNIQTWLEQVGGFAVPQAFARAWLLGGPSVIPTHLVFPKGILVADEADPANAGMHKFGVLTGGTPATYASVDGALDTDIMIGAAILIVSREATPGGTPTLTCTRQDGTTVVIATAPSATLLGQSILGKEAITGVAGAVISCAATAAFKVGEYVTLYENADGDTSLRERGQVKAIVTNTSIELEAAPVNTFTSSGFILPEFVNCAVGSGNMTGGKHLDLYALPHRIIALH